MTNQKIRVVFAGTPQFAVSGLQALINHQQALNIDIVAVYTQPDRKAGRGLKLTPSPVKVLANEYGIKVEQPESFSLRHPLGQVSRETLASYQPDVMVVAAYGLILPMGVLTIPTFGCLNIHASLLPHWRGAAPIHRAILSGDAQTGITIMQMDKGLDTGDMLYKMACDIDENETTQSLHDKLAILGGQAITAVLSDLNHHQSLAIKQDDTQVTYADKITSEEGKIDWQQPAITIYRKICALNAFAYINQERVKVLTALPIKPDQTTKEPAGKVVSVGRNAVLVACGADKNGTQHLINLTSLQWSGKKAWSAEQIANSNKINDGDMWL